MTKDHSRRPGSLIIGPSIDSQLVRCWWVGEATVSVGVRSLGVNTRSRLNLEPMLGLHTILVLSSWVWELVHRCLGMWLISGHNSSCRRRRERTSSARSIRRCNRELLFIRPCSLRLLVMMYSRVLLLLWLCILVPKLWYLM